MVKCIASLKYCRKMSSEEEKDDLIDQQNQHISPQCQNEQDKEISLWTQQHVSTSNTDSSKSSDKKTGKFVVPNEEAAAAVATLASLSSGTDVLPSKQNTEKGDAIDEIAVRKRNRERQRRSELKSQIETLKSMVKRCENEDINSDISTSPSNEGDSSDLIQKIKKRRIHILAGNIGNRIDLLARTISILEKLFETNISLRNKTKEIKKTFRKMEAGKDFHTDDINPIIIDDESGRQHTAMVGNGGPDASGGKTMNNLGANNPATGSNIAMNQSMNELMNATIGLVMPHLSANNRRSSVDVTTANQDASTSSILDENQVSLLFMLQCNDEQ